MEFIVLSFILSFLWAFVGKEMAKSRGRGEGSWWVLCFIFGLFGIAALAMIGPTDEVRRQRAA